MPENKKKSVELADNALITLEQLKMWLQIEEINTEYDDLLTMIINNVSSWVESIIGRPLGLNKYLDQVKGYDMQRITLRFFPIRKVESIRDTLSNVELDPGVYDIIQEGNIGVIYKDDMFGARGYPRGLVPYRYPLSRYLGVNYLAGYVLPKDIDTDYPEEWEIPWPIPSDWLLPGSIIQIALEKAALIFSAADMGGQNLASFGISDVSWSFDTKDKEEWLTILNGFKVL